jgi:hypothetical protein
MANASEIVETYLESKRGKRAGRPTTKEASVTEQATLEIIGALPDGFTRRDVTECVKRMLDGNADVAELKPNARGRFITKALNEAVNAGTLNLSEEGDYTHADPTTGPATAPATTPGTPDPVPGSAAPVAPAGARPLNPVTG